MLMTPSNVTLPNCSFRYVCCCFCCCCAVHCLVQCLLQSRVHQIIIFFFSFFHSFRIFQMNTMKMVAWHTHSTMARTKWDKCKFGTVRLCSRSFHTHTPHIDRHTQYCRKNCSNFDGCELWMCVRTRNAHTDRDTWTHILYLRCEWTARITVI